MSRYTRGTPQSPCSTSAAPKREDLNVVPLPFNTKSDATAFGVGVGVGVGVPLLLAIAGFLYWRRRQRRRRPVDEDFEVDSPGDTQLTPFVIPSRDEKAGLIAPASSSGEPASPKGSASVTASSVVEHGKAKPDPSSGYAELLHELEMTDFSDAASSSASPLSAGPSAPPPRPAPRRPLERVVVQHEEDAEGAEQIRFEMLPPMYREEWGQRVGQAEQLAEPPAGVTRGGDERSEGREEDAPSPLSREPRLDRTAAIRTPLVNCSTSHMHTSSIPAPSGRWTIHPRSTAIFDRRMRGGTPARMGLRCAQALKRKACPIRRHSLRRVGA